MSRSDGAVNTVEGDGSIATGNPSHAEGVGTESSGQGAHAGGIDSIATRVAQFARASGKVAVLGDAQFCQAYLMLQTLDAGPHILLMGDPMGAGVTFQLEDNKSYNYDIMVVARSTAAGISSIWNIKGGIKRVAGVTSKIGGASVITNIANDGGASAVWTVVDTVNVAGDSLDITVATGGAIQTVNWMAVMNWVETLL